MIVYQYLCMYIYIVVSGNHMINSYQLPQYLCSCTLCLYEDDKLTSRATEQNGHLVIYHLPQRQLLAHNSPWKFTPRPVGATPI